MNGKSLLHYEFIDKIGEGGMGEVFRARDTRLDRNVAIKMLPPSLADDPERVARFEREAKTLASVNHSNIALLYGVEDAGGQPFLVMELVEGHDLTERIAAGPIPLEDAIDIARQIAEGVEAAHEVGVVHRDLKPANVKVTPEGKTKILDFGLARAYLDEGAASGNIENSPTITAAMTQQGMILGTAAYMSPEQARGNPVDSRADVWSFGVILWEMLTGRQLFRGDTVSDTLAMVLREPIDWDQLPKDVPPAMRRLLSRCLERDPRKRLRDIGEARIRLERWRDDPTAMQDSSTMMAVAPSARPAWRTVLPWTVAALAVVAAAWGWLMHGGETVAGQRMRLAISLPMEEELSDDRAGGVTISPTGDLIAYIANSEIYTRPLNELEPTRLEGTNGANIITFSPDGKWIAFAGNGKVRRVSVTGGRPLDVCDTGECRGVAWVDKNTLVVSRDITSGLTLITIQGEERELTTVDTDQGERSHRWPAPIPGHNAVIMMCQYMGRNYEDSDIQIVPLGTGERKTVYHGGSYPRYAASGHMLFALDRIIFGVRFLPEKQSTVGLAAPVIDDVLTSVVSQEIDDGSAAYSVSDNGTLLYRRGQRAVSLNSRMAWLDLSNGQQVTFGDPALRDTPVLSPDEKSLAIDRGDMTSTSIYIVDLETQIERRLTSRASDQLGTWSSDGVWLYWSRVEADGWSIMRQRADGSAPAERLRQLPNSSIFYPSSATPDGRYLIGSGRRVPEPYNVQKMSLEGPDYEIADLFETNRLDVDPALSPDGKWIAFASVAETVNILIVPYPPTGASWEVATIDRNDGLSWRGDSKALFVRDGTGILQIDLEFRGATVLAKPPQRLVTENNLRSDGYRAVAVTANGQRALVLQPDRAPDDGTRASSIIFVNDWLPELEQKVADAQ